MTPKIVIPHRDTGAALWEYEATDEQQANGIAMRVALEAATASRANLSGASLDGASLDGASLDGASLDGASLVGASLVGASLVGANLIGHRPMLQIGPIGSRGDVLLAFITDSGLRIRAGCFFGTRDEFVTRVQEEHGDGVHGREYRAAVAMIDAHAAEWTPAAEPSQEAA